MREYKMGAENGGQQTVSKFRTVAPQVLVTTINNLLLMDLSMMLAFPTLVIGDLYGKQGSELSLTEDQASWVGSLVYIFQPIGSAVSGIITEPMGRKRSMMIVNITPLVGWLMLYFSESVTMLYVANAIMGLGIGFMEAPVLCYVGEISQPHLRGILTAYTGVLAQLGYLMVYLLGALMHWRPAAAVSASIPIISVLCMMWIPESPLWLLSRGRTEEALKALCWLRGWVSPDAVRHELEELERYAEATKSTETGSWPLLQRIKNLFKPQTFRPLLLVVAFFFFFHASGMSGVRPYMVHVIEEFQMPIDTHWAAVITALLGLAAIMLLTGTVSFTGKRMLSLISIAGCAIPCLILGTYAYFVAGCKVTDAAVDDRPATWLPLMMLIILSFSTYFGMGQIPWMYVAEVFPLRSRGLASGVTAALAYVLYFTASKTYLALESSLCLYGVFWLYGAFSCVGFAFLYWMLPETEGKTLEEVETFFMGNKVASTATLDTELGASQTSVSKTP